MCVGPYANSNRPASKDFSLSISAASSKHFVTLVLCACDFLARDTISVNICYLVVEGGFDGVSPSDDVFPRFLNEPTKSLMLRGEKTIIYVYYRFAFLMYKTYVFPIPFLSVSDW